MCCLVGAVCVCINYITKRTVDNGGTFDILYSWKFWQGIKLNGLAVCDLTTKLNYASFNGFDNLYNIVSGVSHS